MTNRSKETIRDWIKNFDAKNPLLTKELKAERILRIKAAIQLCNNLESCNLYDKIKVVYPMSNIPLNLKKQ